MPGLTPVIRAATPDDAPALADFVEFASEGLALRVWSKLAGPDGDAWAVGRERARRETGSFSYRNAFVLEADGSAAAGLIGYPLPDAPSPLHRICRPLLCPCRSSKTLPRAAGM